MEFGMSCRIKPKEGNLAQFGRSGEKFRIFKLVGLKVAQIGPG